MYRTLTTCKRNKLIHQLQRHCRGVYSFVSSIFERNASKIISTMHSFTAFGTDFWLWYHDSVSILYSTYLKQTVYWSNSSYSIAPPYVFCSFQINCCFSVFPHILCYFFYRQKTVYKLKFSTASKLPSHI